MQFHISGLADGERLPGAQDKLIVLLHGIIRVRLLLMGYFRPCEEQDTGLWGGGCQLQWCHNMANENLRMVY